jgi:hypothetical protein
MVDGECGMGWCAGGYLNGHCPKAGASIAIASKDGEIVVGDREVVSGERSCTANIAQLANAEERVGL